MLSARKQSPIASGGASASAPTAATALATGGEQTPKSACAHPDAGSRAGPGGSIRRADIAARASGPQQRSARYTVPRLIKRVIKPKRYYAMNQLADFYYIHVHVHVLYLPIKNCQNRTVSYCLYTL